MSSSTTTAEATSAVFGIGGYEFVENADDDGVIEDDDDFDYYSEHSSTSDLLSDNNDDESSSCIDSHDSEQDELSEDYSNDDISSNNEEDDDLMHDIFSDDDGIAEPRRRQRRMSVIILVLSTLLAGLLSNFGYQLYQLSKATRSIGGENNLHAFNDAIDDDNEHIARQTESSSKQLDNTDHHNDENEPHDDDVDEYHMPQYPTRIYTHASLTAKNYRAGGILSDDMLHRYEEDGVLVIRNLISSKLLERLDQASQMVIDDQQRQSKGGITMNKRNGKQFHLVKNGAIFMGVPPKPTACVSSNEDSLTCSSSTKIDENTNDDNDEILSSFRDLAMYSKIPLVAASLLRLDELRVGGEEYLKHRHSSRGRQNNTTVMETNNNMVNESVNLRICRDIFLTKDDDDYACGWHTDDTGFWPSIASDPGVNAWVALDDMPWPERTGNRGDDGPVATFALSLGSHRTSWRHRAYEVTGSTHTLPPEGYQSAADLIERRKGNGTCNIQTSAPDLYDKLEKNKVVYDLRKGDVIFHDRWVFHRTVTMGEYKKMARDIATEEEEDNGRWEQTSRLNSKIFRRYSIRYAPGPSTVPPGYGVELSVLHNEDNANRTMDEIVKRSGLPWYPKVWPNVLKRTPQNWISQLGGGESYDEEIEGMTELVHNIIPKAESLQRERKKHIQQLLSQRGGRDDITNRVMVTL